MTPGNGCDNMKLDRSPKVCPRCGAEYADYPALSRYANAYICPDCGQDEALRPWLGLAPRPLDEWAQPPEEVDE